MRKIVSESTSCKSKYNPSLFFSISLHCIVKETEREKKGWKKFFSSFDVRRVQRSDQKSPLKHHKRLFSITFSPSSSSPCQQISSSLSGLHTCKLCFFADQAHNVTILNRGVELRAGSQHEFTCMAVGSRPAALLTWWFDEMQIRPERDNLHVVSLLLP